jgi:hypothetical protein
MVRRRKHLYRDGARDPELAEFEQRYGVEHGKEVYGETVGKVARERAAKNGGVEIEHVKGHMSLSSSGTPYRVKAHPAYVDAHPHGRGHHGGRCPPGCRQGAVAHRHRSGRRGSNARG